MNKVIDNPLVSIICLTYNHGDYIHDCVNGLVSQKTNFPYEILIHDDASTDNTVKILKQFEDKYKNIFHFVFQKENQYSKKSSRNSTELLISLTKGKYIAFCDGDDYWIHEEKLQKQVDILINNPKYSGCITNGITTKESNPDFKQILFHQKKNNKFFTTKDLINGNPFLYSSTMYRSEVMKNVKDQLTKLVAGDYGLHLYASIQGDIGYLNLITTIHRTHNRGVWERYNEEKKIILSIKNAFKIKKHILNQYDEKKYFQDYIIRLYNELFKIYLKEKNIISLIHTLFSLVIHSRFSISSNRRYFSEILNIFRLKLNKLF